MKDEYMIYKLSDSIKSTSHIDNELFVKHNVKRGLRNEDHSGVLVGLTKIGDVVGYERMPEGGLKAIPGKLVYRGINIEDLVKGIERKTDTALKKRPFSFFQVFYRIKTNWKHLPVCLTNLCL